mmetsp:Transcript_21784/g.82856  ORF Transcript_21784/g.82856 Transcript_21784/m.82856 type:complete len:323 (+) Transcript_21784:923-1891(+)
MVATSRSGVSNPGPASALSSSAADPAGPSISGAAPPSLAHACRPERAGWAVVPRGPAPSTGGMSPGDATPLSAGGAPKGLLGPCWTWAVSGAGVADMATAGAVCGSAAGAALAASASPPAAEGPRLPTEDGAPNPRPAWGWPATSRCGAAWGALEPATRRRRLSRRTHASSVASIKQWTRTHGMCGHVMRWPVRMAARTRSWEGFSSSLAKSSGPRGGMRVRSPSYACVRKGRTPRAASDGMPRPWPSSAMAVRKDRDWRLRNRRRCARGEDRPVGPSTASSMACGFTCETMKRFTLKSSDRRCIGRSNSTEPSVQRWPAEV